MHNLPAERTNEAAAYNPPNRGSSQCSAEHGTQPEPRHSVRVARGPTLLQSAFGVVKKNLETPGGSTASGYTAAANRISPTAIL